MASATVHQLTYPRSKRVAQKLPVVFPGSTLIHSVRLKAPDGFSIDYVENDATKTQFVFEISYNPFVKYRAKRKVPTSTAASIEYVIGDHECGMKGSVQFELIVEPDPEESAAISCGMCTCKYSEFSDNLKPRILTRCGHSFCTECLTTLQQEKQRSFEISCPIDSLITKSLVRCLPYSWAILKMLQELEKQARAEDTPRVDDPIIPCYENSHHESVMYCWGCKGSYCNRCFETAHSNKFMINHASVPLDEKPAFNHMCANHPDKEIQFVCDHPDCELQKLYCSLCKQHHRHDNLPIANEG